jgi:hypothetical protein
MHDKTQTWWGKTRRVVGVALIARTFFESAYKLNKYNKPFDYRDSTSNRKALVLFSVDSNGVYDFYISGVGAQGVMIDVGCLAVGGVLFLWE